MVLKDSGMFLSHERGMNWIICSDKNQPRVCHTEQNESEREKYVLMHTYGIFAGGALVNNPPANPGDAGDVGLIPGSGRAPGVGSGYPLVFLAWKIPWTEEAGRLQSMGLQSVGHY